MPVAASTVLQKARNAAVSNRKTGPLTTRPKRTEQPPDPGDIADDLFADDANEDPAPQASRARNTAKDTSRTKYKLPEDFDPREPLANPKYEKFCHVLIQTGVQAVAYHKAISRGASRKSAQTGGSQIANRPEVAARLRILRGEAVEENEYRGGITRQDKIRMLEKMMQNGTPGDRLRALAEHNKLTGESGAEDERGRALPEPTRLMDYFRRADLQGKDPIELAIEGHDTTTCGSPGPDSPDSGSDPAENSGD